MSATIAGGRSRSRGQADAGGWRLVAALLGACLVVALVVVGDSVLHRALIAGALTLDLLVVAVRSPQLAVRLLLVYLPLMALVRRLMITTTPWTSTDPLLLVAPAVVTLLCVQLFLVERRPLVRDRASGLVVALAVIAVVQVMNPNGGGPVVGAGGLLFFGVPLMWFFLGRELGSRAMVRAILTTIVVMGIGFAAYGLAQTEVGFPPWDRAWMDSVNFAVLNVGTAETGGAIRAFATFSSPSEYLYWLSASTVLCVAAFYERKSALVLALPLLAVALFLGSGRSTLIVAILAIVVMSVLRAFRGRQAGLLIGGAALLTVGLLIVAGPLISRVAGGSSNPLVAHQANGLGNPLDEDDSTVLTHFRALEHGIVSGFTNPIGMGTGASNTAADSLGGGAVAKTTVDNGGYEEEVRGTDTDIGNVFLSFGAVGGLVYVALLWTLARALVRRYARWRDPVLLAVIGYEVVLIAEWLRGEQYAIAALTWFLIGWATRSQEDPRLEDVAADPEAASTAPARPLHLPTRGPAGVGAAPVVPPVPA